jgi:hypothetical protein
MVSAIERVYLGLSHFKKANNPSLFCCLNSQKPAGSGELLLEKYGADDGTRTHEYRNHNPGP